MRLWWHRSPTDVRRKRGHSHALSRFALAAFCSWSCAGTANNVAIPDNEELLPGTGSEALSSAETLRADVGIAGIHVGTMESTWCPDTPAGGARVWSEMTPAALLKALMHASGRAQTDWGPSAEGPSASAYDIREGDILRRYRVSYHAGRYDYVYERGGIPQLEGTDSVPENARAHDMQSALVALRAWRPRLDARAHFYVVLGRRLWRADVSFAGPQVIKVQGVPRLTTRVDGTAHRLWDAPDAPGPRSFSIWFGEEPERLPVLLTADGKYGAVTMTLRERASLPAACDGVRVPQAGFRAR